MWIGPLKSVGKLRCLKVLLDQGHWQAAMSLFLLLPYMSLLPSGATATIIDEGYRRPVRSSSPLQLYKVLHWAILSYVGRGKSGSLYWQLRGASSAVGSSAFIKYPCQHLNFQKITVDQEFSKTWVFNSHQLHALKISVLATISDLEATSPTPTRCKYFFLHKGVLSLPSPLSGGRWMRNSARLLQYNWLSQVVAGCKSSYINLPPDLVWLHRVLDRNRLCCNHGTHMSTATAKM